MDVVFTTFLAALLAEFGDKTQLLAIALVARYGRPGEVLGGVAVAALANNAIAAAGGALIHDHITLRAISLLVAVALVYAGINALVRQKTPDMGSTWKTGAFLTTAGCFFLLEFADKTQFVTGALAAQFDSLVLATAGATAGVVLANVPAIMLGERMESVLPMRRVRFAIAALFLLGGFFVAINALRLV